MVAKTMYDIGFEHGYLDAVYCCLGGHEHSTPEFDTPDEQFDYVEGYEHGYASVD